MPTRIAYLVNQYPKVSHSFIRREIVALEQMGFDVQRIALRGWDGDLADEDDIRERARTRYVLQDGIAPLVLSLLWALVRRPYRFFLAFFLAVRMSARSERRLPYHLAYLAEACRILGWVTHAHMAHIHAHFGTNSAEVAMLLRVLGGPTYSFTIHGIEVFDKPEFVALQDKAERASFVVATSSYGRGQLYRWIAPSEWPKVNVIRCGLEARFFTGTPLAPPHAPRVVCVGRLSEEKGQLLLVEAAARLAAKGVNFQLVLAGDGPMRPLLEASIAKHSLQQRVEITGWISSQRVREEILASRALVLPSFAEGLPVVIMEAMALRRPVLTTYVAGIPELVRPGENGWLIPAGDLDELIVALEIVVSSSVQDLKALGDAAYVRVMQLHSIDKEAAKLAHVIRETISACS